MKLRYDNVKSCRIAGRVRRSDFWCESAPIGAHWGALVRIGAHRGASGRIGEFGFSGNIRLRDTLFPMVRAHGSVVPSSAGAEKGAILQVADVVNTIEVDTAVVGGQGEL